MGRTLRVDVDSASVRDGEITVFGVVLSETGIVDSPVFRVNPADGSVVDRRGSTVDAPPPKEMIAAAVEFRRTVEAWVQTLDAADKFQ